MKRLIFILVTLCILISYLFYPRLIDPTDYSQQMDYGTLTETEIQIFQNILDAVEQGQSVIHCASQEYDGHKLKTHLGMYYGEVNGFGGLFIIVNGDIELNLRECTSFEENRVAVDAEVDKALMHIREGSDRYKLWQISRYIARNYDYTEDFVCADYSILFYKIASRLGIKTYVCFGYVDDVCHAWNMAELDGMKYYYDITWYDGWYNGPFSNDRRYIHSTEPWGRATSINDRWGDCITDP